MSAQLSKGCPRRGAWSLPSGGHLGSLSHQGGPRGEDSLAQTAAASLADSIKHRDRKRRAAKPHAYPTVGQPVQANLPRQAQLPVPLGDTSARDRGSAPSSPQEALPA